MLVCCEKIGPFDSDICLVVRLQNRCILIADQSGTIKIYKQSLSHFHLQRKHHKQILTFQLPEQIDVHRAFLIDDQIVLYAFQSKSFFQISLSTHSISKTTLPHSFEMMESGNDLYLIEMSNTHRPKNNFRVRCSNGVLSFICVPLFVFNSKTNCEYTSSSEFVWNKATYLPIEPSRCFNFKSIPDSYPSVSIDSNYNFKHLDCFFYIKGEQIFYSAHLKHVFVWRHNLSICQDE